MPSWLILVLQWGGLALAALSAVALVYVLGIPGIMEPVAEAEAARAPVTMYWVLLVIGAVCAVVGFIMGRRKPTAVGQS